MMWEMRNVYKFVVEKYEEKVIICFCRCRWENNILSRVTVTKEDVRIDNWIY
jgi:hypothetical protein